MARRTQNAVTEPLVGFLNAKALVKMLDGISFQEELPTINQRVSPIAT